MALSSYNRRTQSDESVELEGQLVRQSEKAYLIYFTNVDTEVWVPKSQCEMLGEEGEKLRTFRVRAWLVEKNNLA